jgi:hypothetical protein
MPAELWQLHQGLAPETAEPGPDDTAREVVTTDYLPGRPAPAHQPPGADEQRSAQQYYRPFWRVKTWDIDLSALPAVGQRILPLNQSDTLIRFPARSMIIDNLSGYSFLLQAGADRIFIGPSIYNLIRPLPDVSGEVVLIVFAAAAAAPCIFTFTEEALTPNPGTPSSAGGTAATVNIGQVGGAAVALGQNVMASSFPVVLASNQSAIPITTGGPLSVNPTASLGNTNLGTGTNTLAGGTTTISTVNGATRSILSIRSRTSNNASGLQMTGGAMLFPGDAISLGYKGSVTLTGTTGDVLDWWETYG